MFPKTSEEMFCGLKRQWFNALEDVFMTSAFKAKNISEKDHHSAIKHTGGRGVMLWDGFAASGPERFVLTDGAMNTSLSQKILLN